MAVRPAVAVLASLTLGACGGGNVDVLLVEIVSAEGGNPAAGITGRLELELLDVTGGGRSTSTDVDDGDFELDLRDIDFTIGTEVRARLTGEDRAGSSRRLLGAFPAVRPASFAASCPRLALVAAGRCELLDVGPSSCGGALELPGPVTDVAAVRWVGAQFLTFGGRQRDGEPTERIALFERVDLLGRELGDDAVRGGLGPAQAVSLREDRAVLLGDRDELRVMTTERFEPEEGAPLALHRGAGAGTLVDVEPGVAAVLGGEATDLVTWVELLASGELRTSVSRLATPRTRPLAVSLGGALLVTGGAADSAPAAEWVEPFRDGEARPTPALGSGRGEHLVAGPTGTSALLVGPPDGDGPSPRTLLLQECATVCTVDDGPAWSPRARSRVVATAEGTTWIVGGEVGDEASAVTEWITWVEGSPGQETPRLVRGPDLVDARAGPALIEQAAGLVLVLGGEHEGGLRRSVELCAPSDLP